MNEMSIKFGEEKIKLTPYFSYPQYQRMRNYNAEAITGPEMIHVITGLPIKKIKQADLKQIEDISKILANVYFSGDTKAETKVTFIHNGIEYGLQTNFSKLAWGAWVDLEVYTSEKIEDNIPKILSLFYYPVKSKKGSKIILEDYSDELVEQTAEEFKDIPMEVWFGFTSFFLLFVKTYIENIQSSLAMTKKVENLIQMGKRILPKFLQKRL